jgi:hypothetical protein
MRFKSSGTHQLIGAILILVIGCASAPIADVLEESLPPYTGDLKTDFDLIRAEYKLGEYDCTDQAQVLRDYLLSYDHIEQRRELFFVIGKAVKPVVWHEQEEHRYPDPTHVWLEYWYVETSVIRSGPLVVATERRHYYVYDPLRGVLGELHTPYYLSEHPEAGMETRKVRRALPDNVLKETTDFRYRAIGDRYWQGQWWNTDGTPREP